MGDRTYCNLNLQKPADHGVQALIVGHLGMWSENYNDMRWFGFEEVNYANLPKDFITDMIKLGLSFSWSWAAGDAYGPGVIVCDGKDHSEWNTDVNGEVVLSLPDIDNPQMVASARRWNDIYSAIRSMEIPA